MRRLKIMLQTKQSRQKYEIIHNQTKAIVDMQHFHLGLSTASLSSYVAWIQCNNTDTVSSPFVPLLLHSCISPSTHPLICCTHDISWLLIKWLTSKPLTECTVSFCVSPIAGDTKYRLDDMTYCHTHKLLIKCEMCIKSKEGSMGSYTCSMQ